MLRLLSGPASALLLMLAGCERPAQRADALAQQASQLADAGHNKAALEAINKAIALRDDNAGYFLLLASIQVRAGNTQAAFVAGERALEVDAANVDALTLVANVGFQAGQLDDANDAANRLLALDPNSLVGLQVKGLYELAKDRNVDADATAERLLAIDPVNIPGIVIRSRVLAKAGKMEEALAFVNHAIDQSSPSAPLLISKINLYRALERPEDMATTFAALDAATPERSPALRLDEINLLYELGRRDQARAATLSFLAARNARAADLAVLQRIWWEFDQVPFTAETIVAARDWGDPIALLAVGRYLLWQNQPQLADDLFFSYPAAVRPTGLAIHDRASLGLGREQDARNETALILKRDPDNVDALLLRAEFEKRAGNLGLAIEAAQRALNSDHTDPEVYVVLAELQAKAGAAWRAAQIFEDGLQQLPQNYLLIEHYTQFLHESGNKSRAVSVTRDFARALPSSVRAWTVMAQQCSWASDAACAAEAAAGREAAAKRYRLDDPPGAPPDRGLLGKF